MKSVQNSIVLGIVLVLGAVQGCFLLYAFLAGDGRSDSVLLVLDSIVIIIVASFYSFLFFKKRVVGPINGIGELLDRIDDRGRAGRPGQYEYSGELNTLYEKVKRLGNRLAERALIPGGKGNGSNNYAANSRRELRELLSERKAQAGLVASVENSLAAAMRTAREISERTEALQGISGENVTSTLEIKATAEEIASNSAILLSSAEDTLGTSVEMGQIARMISDNALEISRSVQEASSSLQQIDASLGDVRNASSRSSELAHDVTSLTSETGMMSIVDAVEGIEKITEYVKKSVEIMNMLSLRSSDIQKVLSVIRDVTAQTNLLSLNAAILAVQAGEYGKSFSVVADEMNSLSERTAASTRDIEKIVWTVQEKIAEASSVMDSLSQSVDEGNALIMKVGDSLRLILHASQLSEEMAGTIEKATSEQSEGVAHVVRAVEEIRELSEQTSSSSQQHDSAISYLLKKISDMKDNIEMIKKATEEQAKGTTMISRNLEETNEIVSGIALTLERKDELDRKALDSISSMKEMNSRAVWELESEKRLTDK